MPAQRRTTTTPTAQRPPPARPQAVAPRSTSNADRQAQVGTADPVVEAPTQDPKTVAIEAYATRLWEVVGELMLLDDTKLQAARARAVMGQAADVDFALRMGERVEVDLLPRYPEGDLGRMPVGALPPRWVQPARILLQMGGGSGASPTFQPEGGSTDLWQAGQAEVSTPWAGPLEAIKKYGRQPADYGVAGYQTQSNNLASPEATCNGTSLAMVLERLGYTREDLIDAIETKLKRAQLQADLDAKDLPAAEVKKQMDAFDPSCVGLRDATWKTRVLQYLRAENGDRHDSEYQRLRGASQTDDQLKSWAGEFKENAGMDDLALFMMDLLNIERTTVNSGANPSKLVSAVHKGSGKRNLPQPTTERVETSLGWTKAKVKLQECLDEGGSAMLSIKHKGAGQSGTHIVAVQAVTAGGITVDDPFGKARADYDAGERGDAYATAGKTRANSGLKNVKQGLNDWKMSASVDAEERRGESSDWTDDMVRSAWFYMVLFHPGKSAPAPSPTAGGAQAVATP